MTQCESGGGYEIDIIRVLKALSDPVRLLIICSLLQDEPGTARHCSTFGLTVSRATRSHHFRVLREAGLIRVIDRGNMALAVLCREEIQKELPGLFELLSRVDTTTLLTERKGT